MVRARVTANARVHFGFQNLSLAHERLYGGMGAALSAPRVVVEASPAPDIDAPDPVAGAADRAVELLGVEGARVRLPESLPRHVGLGSGTQHALAVYAAVAAAHEVDPTPRDAAPDLGRGGRSGVGVAAFERGGFVVDAGHPTGQFTTERPAVGEWTVPGVAARHELPDDWRVLLVRPDADAGRSGDREAVTMREVVEAADADVADRIAGILTRRLLPAAAEGDLAAFGDALTAISRLNGAWYADEQGGVFRPPVGEIVDTLSDAAAVVGAGQSSWGPTTFGLTRSASAEAAREAGRGALDAADVDGTVELVGFADRGARIERLQGAGSDK